MGTVTAYPVAGKTKSYDICRAFADGCGGEVANAAPALQEGAAFFYGVDQSNEHIWRAVLRERREYYYADNAFFDSARQQYFRVAKNRLQHDGVGTSDCKRFDDLGIDILPWRSEGDHIVICPQSKQFMQVLAQWHGDWTLNMIQWLGALTRRPLRVRAWNANKTALAKTLGDDLTGAHALVTHSSAAAITAVLSGVPVAVTGECAAEGMATKIESIERPHMASAEERRAWAGVLADNQWTLQEFKSGAAWQSLSA